jgi:hypothetical protein
MPPKAVQRKEKAMDAEDAALLLVCFVAALLLVFGVI